MSYSITQSDEAIDDTLNRAIEAIDTGVSQWPGMSYEQGVDAAIRWLIGQSDENPMDE